METAHSDAETGLCLMGERLRDGELIGVEINMRMKIANVLHRYKVGAFLKESRVIFENRQRRALIQR